MRLSSKPTAAGLATVLLLGISAVMLLPVLRKGETEFEWVYLRTARHLAAGVDIYDPGTAPFRAFTYPPFMAALGLPFAAMPKTVARLAWYAANVACLVLLWRGAWTLSGGGGAGGRKEHVIAGLGLACGLIYALSNMDHQQTDLLVSAMLIGGVLALARGRDLTAAALFGVSAGMKCTALLWIPFLLVRGRWKAAVVVAAVAVGINLIPDLIARPAAGSPWMVAWFGRFLTPMAGAGYYPGRWFAWILDNQSIAGAATRWTTMTWTWSSLSGVEILDRSRVPGARLIQLVVYAVEAGLLFAALAIVRRPQPVEGSKTSREAVEGSIVLMMMLLLSPMSSRPHFSTMFLPGLILAREAIGGGRRSRWAMVWLIASIAASLAAAPMWGRSAARLSMWMGMLTWSAAVLMIGCAGLLVGREVDSIEKRTAPLFRGKHLSRGRAIR